MTAADHAAIEARAAELVASFGPMPPDMLDDLERLMSGSRTPGLDHDGKADITSPVGEREPNESGARGDQRAGNSPGLGEGSGKRSRGRRDRQRPRSAKRLPAAG